MCHFVCVCVCVTCLSVSGGPLYYMHVILCMYKSQFGLYYLGGGYSSMDVIVGWDRQSYVSLLLCERNKPAVRRKKMPTYPSYAEKLNRNTKQKQNGTAGSNEIGKSRTRTGLVSRPRALWKGLRYMHCIYSR
ncbi:hypothetical protein QBC44DRAFT_337205 [Cladorrhinum sp. PSN332]|nr:hypothetical protein QBC44DRAFT_337205 [Cladorrhinum sp. PSN332]